jgi:hypothetical protein
VSHQRIKKPHGSWVKNLLNGINDNDFEIPASQQSTFHQETFWRFD